MASDYPLLVVPCKRGGVPCLTPDQAREILNEKERLMSVSVFDACEYVGPCKKANSGFSDFCGLADFTTILTLRSPHVGMHASAPVTDTGVWADHEKGRICVGMDKWKEMVLSLCPSIAIPPYDAVSAYELQTKRRRTALARSVKWATAAASIQNDIKCKLMNPVSTMENNAEYIFLENVSQNETLQEYAHRVKEAACKGRVMSPALSLPAVLICLKANVCFIECALPWILAEKGVALVFDLKPLKGETPPRYETQIDLNDESFTEDIRPLSPDCDCYTCKRHMRAYIHHLLTVQEMNSKTLLVIHNLSRLAQLFRLYRLSSARDREVLLNWLFVQL